MYMWEKFKAECFVVLFIFIKNRQRVKSMTKTSLYRGYQLPMVVDSTKVIMLLGLTKNKHIDCENKLSNPSQKYSYHFKTYPLPSISSRSSPIITPC